MPKYALLKAKATADKYRSPCANNKNKERFIFIMADKEWYRKYTDRHLDGNAPPAEAKTYVHPIPNARVFINGKPVVMEVPKKEKGSFAGRIFDKIAAKIFLVFLSTIMFAVIYLLKKDMKERQQEKA